MFILLPIVCWVIIFLIFNKTCKDWRDSVISTSVSWGVILTITTESLSYFKLISFSWLTGGWILISILLTYIYFRIVPKLEKTSATNNHLQIEQNYKKKLPINLLLYGVGFIVILVGLIARIAPSNNWDSMDYHMSRVVYWIQYHSVSHYPTSYTPQLYQNPWSEFTILNFQILSSSDYYANLVQWFSMIGCIIAVSLIAKQLGADLKGQVFAAVVTATIPMGILQASSTQNDYVLAFWVVCLAYYVLAAAQEEIRGSYTNSFKAFIYINVTICWCSFI